MEKAVLLRPNFSSNWINNVSWLLWRMVIDLHNPTPDRKKKLPQGAFQDVQPRDVAGIVDPLFSIDKRQEKFNSAWPVLTDTWTALIDTCWWLQIPDAQGAKRSQRFITPLIINHIPGHANSVRLNMAVREQMTQYRHRYINPVFNLTSKKNSMVRRGFVNSMTNLIELFHLQGLGLFGIQAKSSTGKPSSSEPFFV